MYELEIETIFKDFGDALTLEDIYDAINFINYDGDFSIDFAEGANVPDGTVSGNFEVDIVITIGEADAVRVLSLGNIMLSQLQNLTADENNQLRTSVNVVVDENPATDDIVDLEEEADSNRTEPSGEAASTLPETGVAAVGGVGLISSMLALLGGSALLTRRKRK